MVSWLVVSYNISTLVGYLMLNPVYTYTLDIWFVNEYFVRNNFYISQGSFVCSELIGFKYC